MMATMFEIMKERAQLRARGVELGPLTTTEEATYPIKVFEPTEEQQERRRLQLRLAAQQYQLKKKYGITKEMYDRQLARQKGVCAICKKSPTNKLLAVDHNHKTGTVRSLLCSRCNRAIGLMFEDTQLLKAAIEYLDYWSEGKQLYLRDEA